MAELSPSNALPSRGFAARAREFARNKRHVFSLAAVLILAAWLVFTWWETVRRLARYYTPLPTWDYWRTAALLPLYRALDLRVLWQQHNEHRVVFPEIVFAADYLLLHGRQILPLAVSFLCYVGSWVVLAWAFDSDKSTPSCIRKAGISLAGIIIGWQGSAVVLADTFLLQWTLLQFAVLLALAFLARLERTRAIADLLAVAACATVATYSSANGLTLWPLLLVIAWLAAIPKRHLGSLGVCAILVTGLYFIGYRFTGSSLSAGSLFRHPGYAIEFVGDYLSMPFGAIKSTQFGVRLGLVAIAVVIAFGVAAWRNRFLASKPGIVLFGAYAFMLQTAALTAGGRMEPRDALFGAAKASRYLTGPLIAWAVLILLSLWLSSRLHWRFARPAALAAVFAILMLAGLPKLRWWLAGEDQRRAKEQLAALGIELGLEDPGVDLNVFMDPVALSNWAAELQKHNLSVFDEPYRRKLGDSLAGFGTLETQVIPGAITYVYPVLGGVEVAGWADDSQLRHADGWIVLANERGTIAGFARRLPAGFPGELNNHRTPPALGWAGFVDLKYATQSFAAYAIEQGRLFPIDGAMSVPAMSVVEPQAAGPQVSPMGWKMDKTWSIGTLPPHGWFGQGPPGPIYASWSGDDKNTGRIESSPFPAPENACLILPVLQGPRTNGLYVALVDAGTGSAIAEPPLQNTDKQWIFWRVPLPASARRVRLVAADNGKDYGEWIAVGTPALCR